MTLRGVDWAVVTGACAGGAAVLAACVAFSGDDPPLGYARLALVALAGAAAFVLDEPAAAAVDATPSALRRRTAWRAIAGLVPFSVWTTGVLVLEQRRAATPAIALLTEGAGVLAVAVALAAVLRREGRTEPGEVVAVGLGAALLGVLILRPAPRVLPLFPAGGDWGPSDRLWYLLAVLAVCLVVAGSRDPCR